MLGEGSRRWEGWRGWGGRWAGGELPNLEHFFFSTIWIFNAKSSGGGEGVREGKADWEQYRCYSPCRSMLRAATVQ
tara:strand:+ start:653 stop:880 length:228 start_codon:yes stop_codon:yes gene_type:complete